MTNTFEHLHTELDTLRSQITCLEEAEKILRPVYESSTRRGPTVPVESDASRNPRQRNPTQTQLCDYIAGHHPITRGELLAALGGNSNAMDRKLRLLLMDGKIGTDGRPGRRRYRPTDPQLRALNERPRSSPEVPRRGVYPMYDEILDLGGSTTEDLARRMGKPVSQIVKEGRKLLQLKLVKIGGNGSTRAWFPANSPTKGKV